MVRNVKMVNFLSVNSTSDQRTVHSSTYYFTSEEFPVRNHYSSSSSLDSFTVYSLPYTLIHSLIHWHKIHALYKINKKCIYDGIHVVRSYNMQINIFMFI